MSASFSTELQQWIVAQHRLGFSVETLVEAMVQAGHAPADAHRAVQQVLTEQQTHTDCIAPECGGEDDNALQIQGRQIPILFGLSKPHITLFQHFLEDAECEALIALSQDRLARSPVVHPETGAGWESSKRSSQGAMFQVGEYPLLAHIEARIAEVVGIPIEHGEGMQILHYRPGGEYRPHHDYFDLGKPGERGQIRVGGQRVATLIMYLNTVEAGGATAFPSVGLEIAPVKGNAVFFVYQQADGGMDPLSLHAGLPVVRGEKWIATKWLRERPYR